MIRVAIMASGTGSNAKALLQEELGLTDVSIDLIISDKPQAGVLEIAKSFSKNAIVIDKKGLSKEEHESKILEELYAAKIDWVFLAGYMRILSSGFIQNFYDDKIGQSRIINIHPSLLPLYRGLNAYEKAFEDKSKNTGITIHFVDSGMDTGKIIIQEKFQYNFQKGLEGFKKAGLSLEHKIYPQILRSLPELHAKGQL